MFVTEEQAKEMWCPAARVAVGNRKPDDTIDLPVGASVFNRMHLSGPPPQLHIAKETLCCIGASCMWWETVAGEDGKGFCGHNYGAALKHFGSR